MKGKKVLIVLAAICVLPLLASYAMYFLWRPDSTVNYGQLLSPRALPAEALTTVDVSATTTATLYPGATGDAFIKIANPNNYNVAFTAADGSDVDIFHGDSNNGGGVARDVLLDQRTRERGIIEPSAVEALLSAHRDGRQDGTDAIWSLMNLELWYRTFIDGEGVQSLPAPAAPAASAPTARREPPPPAHGPARRAGTRSRPPARRPSAPSGGHG